MYVIYYMYHNVYMYHTLHTYSLIVYVSHSIRITMCICVTYYMYHNVYMCHTLCVSQCVYVSYITYVLAHSTWVTYCMYHNVYMYHVSQCVYVCTTCITMCICITLYIQPIPLGVTFSKAPNSKLESLFCHVSVKRNFRALIFEL